MSLKPKNRTKVNLSSLNGRHYSLAHMAKYGHQFDSTGSIGDKKGGSFGSLERRLSIA